MAWVAFVISLAALNSGGSTHSNDSPAIADPSPSEPRLAPGSLNTCATSVTMQPHMHYVIQRPMERLQMLKARNKVVLLVYHLHNMCVRFVGAV